MASVAGRRSIFAQQYHAEAVLDAIRWLHGAGRVFVDAAVVMPDHLQLARQLGQCTMANVMHTLKGFSAKQIAKLESIRLFGKKAIRITHFVTKTIIGSGFNI